MKNFIKLHVPAIAGIKKQEGDNCTTEQGKCLKSRYIVNSRPAMILMIVIYLAALFSCKNELFINPSDIIPTQKKKKYEKINLF
jgi:hypothetical protein